MKKPKRSHPPKAAAGTVLCPQCYKVYGSEERLAHHLADKHGILDFRFLNI